MQLDDARVLCYLECTSGLRQKLIVGDVILQVRNFRVRAFISIDDCQVNGEERDTTKGVKLALSEAAQQKVPRPSCLRVSKATVVALPRDQSTQVRLGRHAAEVSAGSILPAK